MIDPTKIPLQVVEAAKATGGFHRGSSSRHVSQILAELLDVAVHEKLVCPALSEQIFLRALALAVNTLFCEKIHVPMAGFPKTYLDQARHEVEEDVRNATNVMNERPT